MTGEQLDIYAEAESRKQQGMAQADAGTDQWWRDCCDRGISHLARTGRVFEAFDLIDLGVPEPRHPSQWGPRFSAAAKRGVITAAGYGPSKRPTVAKSAVRLWRGAQCASAFDQALDRLSEPTPERRGAA